MALIHKAYTAPVPKGAKIVDAWRDDKGKLRTDKRPEGAAIVRAAQWVDRNNKRRLAPVTVGRDGSDRVLCRTKTKYAKHRDGAGVVVTTATGCHDEAAARSVEADLVHRAQLVKGKVLSAGEARMIDHARAPLAEHWAAYDSHLQAKGVVTSERKTAWSYFRRIAEPCSFTRLSDLRREPLENWLALRAAEADAEDREIAKWEAENKRAWSGGWQTLGARSRNAIVKRWRAFAKWCMETGRLQSNPFTGVALANEKADERRPSRALTEDEMKRLLRVAQLRPLAERGRETVRTASGRKGWRPAPLTITNIEAAAERARTKRTPARVAALELIGRERGLIYKTYILTGLRRDGLAAVKVGDVHLDAAIPHILIGAADAKNGLRADVPLRADLVADLRIWITDRKLSPTAPLFNIPAGLLRIMDRDLSAANIPKRDEQGRVVHIHAIRKSFASHLAQGGVPLTTVQRAMHHSDPSLTANVYVDPAIQNTAAALNVLPKLPLSPPADEREALRKTGTDDARTLAPFLAPTGAYSGQELAFSDTNKTQSGGGRATRNRTRRSRVSADSEKTCQSRQDIRGDRIRTCDLLTPSQAR